MGRNKKYSGYKAYQYLSPGIDYRPFKLRKAIKEEWAYTVPLSTPEEEQAEEILEKHIVIDLHEHPTIMPEDALESIDLWREGREFMAYEALSHSGLDAVFDNLMNGEAYITSKHGWKWSDTIHDLGQRLCDIAHQDFVIHCKKVEDITKAHKTGRLAWVAVFESVSCIENEVDRIDVLYGLGIRSMGLIYSESNMLGSGQKELRDGGLTDFGYDAVVRMNKIGMLIDVSHSSYQTVLDAIEASKEPIIISHSGARALTPTNRMFPDEVLQALAEKEGIIGIEAAPGITATKKHPVHSIDSYMEHIEYCIELMGIDNVGCGPDAMYGDHVGFYRLEAERLKTDGMGHYTRTEREKESLFLDINMDPKTLPVYVKGMENPTECLQNVTRWMVKQGYSDQEIAKVIGGNALRLLKQVW
ncbi:MAG: dipeptidase [Candidatus Heimdallarchaeota archaeon]